MLARLFQSANLEQSIGDLARLRIVVDDELERWDAAKKSLVRLPAVSIAVDCADDLSGGACRDRTYDQSVKSRMLYL